MKIPKHILGKVLLHPATILVGMAVGVYIGIESPALATKLAKPGTIYLNLLQMCVLPLMISAVILSIGRLLMSGEASRYILRLVTVFVLGMLIASAVGSVFGVVLKPGSGLGSEQKAMLGKEIVKAESEVDAQNSSMPQAEKQDMFDFLGYMIPTNVFSAISEGQNLPVLFFCLILGVAFGTLKTHSSEVALALADASYEALLRVISWLMYGLPFGLCFLFADQIGRMGTSVFSALLKLIIIVYAASFAMIIAYAVIIWIRSGRSPLKALSAMKQAFIVAVGTSNSFAALPFALEGLHKDLDFEKETVDLIIPLGINLNPHGNMICFSIMAIFMSQLYDVSLSMGTVLNITIMSVFAGIAASSAPGIVALSMIALVLKPLGLPVVVGVILLTAINPIVDPILTGVNIMANFASASLIAERRKTEQEDDEDDPNQLV